METWNHTATLNAENISRLGFRTMQEPVVLRCIRNGEALELNVYYFESRNVDAVIYYTDVRTIATGKTRHSTAFRFRKRDHHELMHKYCLHLLFFDEKIAETFEEENTFTPAPHIDQEKAAQYMDAVRYYWNSRHFANTYKMLGGMESQKEIMIH